MSILDIWHLIDGKYIHIVQISEGVTRTFYTNGKKEGKVDITGPLYSERKYEKQTRTVKSSTDTWEMEVATY